MNNLTEQKKYEGVFPKGKITLLDGLSIDCHPRVSKDMETQANEPSSAETEQSREEREMELFLKNAFKFWEHKERILTDSRMFLCRVPVRAGLNRTGPSYDGSPTLGVYLQWWDTCEGTVRTDRKGRRSLVYLLAGSMMSGANHCDEVTENGSTRIVQLYPFCDYWKSFMDINRMYEDAKHRYQAYSLQQVVDILDHEEQGDKEYACRLGVKSYQDEIEYLDKRISLLDQECEMLRKERQDLQHRQKEETAHYVDQMVSTEAARITVEIERLWQQKRSLKSALWRGDCTQEQYEQQSPLIDEQLKKSELRLLQLENEKDQYAS